ncbi:hypothetical protein WN55_09010 [Dufourea novaeangliae]|nr:hypothetical protein WN55_09010 [Dufourea novaeangliae]
MIRRIVYANKKYHSGLMCSGVTIGLAIMKLSGSPNINGFIEIKVNNIIIIIKNPMISFVEKYG